MTRPRWEFSQDRKSATLYSGEIAVGSIGERIDGSFYYSIWAVHTKWVTKGHGDVGSIKQARRSLMRAWNQWLLTAGLK